jgi:hypothetical protein
MFFTKKRKEQLREAFDKVKLFVKLGGMDPLLKEKGLSLVKLNAYPKCNLKAALQIWYLKASDKG